MEADLAFKGIDLRDFWRRGSGLTARRLLLLVQSLPHDALLWQVLEADKQKALTGNDRLRERQAYYDQGGT